MATRFDNYVVWCIIKVFPLLIRVSMALNFPSKMIAGDTVLSDNYVNDTQLILKHGVHIGTYPSLPVPSRCNIRRCLRNTQMAKDYYEYCFTEQCHYGSYHCVSGQGIIVHFCAKFDDCRQLHRHIPVFNKTTNHIEVFEVPCELGYFQRNEQHSCFPACVKDESRGFYDQGEGLPIQAYCVPSSHRCNVYGKMFFYPDTPDDDCSGKPRCKENEDPLPDCSCDAKCPQGETRQPSTRFKCTENSGVETLPSSTQEHDKLTTPKKVLTNADDTMDEYTPREADDESKPEVNDEVKPNRDERQPTSEHISILGIVAIVCVSCVAVAAVSSGGIYIYNNLPRGHINDERSQQPLTVAGSNNGNDNSVVGINEDRAVESSHAEEPQVDSSSHDIRMDNLKLPDQNLDLSSSSQTDLKQVTTSQP